MSISLIKTLQKLELSAVEKATALAFASHIWENDPAKGAWVGADVLARESGESVRNIGRGLRGLKEKRILIKRGHYKGKSAYMPIYTVHPENGTPYSTGPKAGESANLAESHVKESANLATESAKTGKESANLVSRVGQFGRREREQDKDKEKKEKHSSFSSETKTGSQGKADRKDGPGYEEAKKLVRQILHECQGFGVLLGQKHKEALLDDLLDSPEVLKWESEVLAYGISGFLRGIPTEDPFDKSQAAGRIATSLVTCLVGGGRGRTIRDKYFDDKGALFAVYLSTEQEAKAVRRNEIIRGQELDAEEEYLLWSKDNGSLEDSDFVPSDPAAYERWFLTEQMKESYPEERKKLHQKLEALRSAVVLAGNPPLEKAGLAVAS